jgi:hypothetical protein
MATVLLQIAGQTIGSMLGGPFGGAVGSAIGATVGGMIDQSLIGALAGPRRARGPRVAGVSGLAAEEGGPIPRLYGVMRVGGQIIWATRFVESVNTRRVGGKNGTTVSESTFFANLAVGLCEGPIAEVRRVFADGKELDLTTIEMRVHRGDEAQTPDPLIVAKEGADAAPAYRGLAYVVFEGLPLAPYGNRVPSLSFEVARPVAGGTAERVRAVAMIPGATEFGYDTLPVARTLGERSIPENRHQMRAETDFLASLDSLEGLCPRLAHVSLVVSWFGDDLRAGVCRIRPMVDDGAKTTAGGVWSVAGLERGAAAVVSRVGAAAAYGGTPSDASVIRAIRELKARGIAVTLYPFVMMDIPAGTGKPDPWSAGEQPAYPWRGRITCHPAPGQAGSPDGTAAAAAQIAALFGAVAASDFSVSDGAVQYSGPAGEWSLRRQALHCAALAKAAGGVDALVIGSEFAALTRVRDGAGGFPAVGALRALAAEIRALLGPATRLTYAADWTEYGAQVFDGGAEVRFPLDPLWADPVIDAVGIDWYAPLSDWRDGPDHADRALSATGADADYLLGRFAAGEAFDWFYADAADRAAQTRTPIADGAYGKPFVFRRKDLPGWWSNLHFERIGGVERPTPTPWQPRMKPIWLTEAGCPAVDKGANQPNLFPDAKSSEDGVPYASDGRRDDLVQARVIEALMRRFDPQHPRHDPAHNPQSPIYGGPMVDPARIAVWAYDARPFPAFPLHGAVWGDAANWERGHWLNGRLEGVTLDRLIAAILDDFGLPPADLVDVDGFLDGYLIDRPMAARDALDPLVGLYGLKVSSRAGGLRFAGPRSAIAASFDPARLAAPARDGAVVDRVRADEGDALREVAIRFLDGLDGHRPRVAVARRTTAATDRTAVLDLPAALDPAECERLAGALLDEAAVGRESLRVRLPPSGLALEPGDHLTLEGVAGVYRIERVADGADRAVEARATPRETTRVPPPRRPLPSLPAPDVAGPARGVVLDLPLLPGETAALNRIAVAATPWVGPRLLWRSADAGPFEVARRLSSPAALGETLSPLPPGPVWRIDHGSAFEARLDGAALATLGDTEFLGLAQLFAVGPPGGPFELVAAGRAEAIAPGRWRLSRLLRGLGGGESLAARVLPGGAVCVMLDRRVPALETDPDLLGAPIDYRVTAAGRLPTDPFALSLSASPGAASLLPLSPVHPRAVRRPEGVHLRWIRRTRIGGDGWGAAEPPLGEDRLAFSIAILDGASVLRTAETAAESWLYPNAAEAADFGAARTSLRIRIAQSSALAGEGAPLEAVVPVA